MKFNSETHKSLKPSLAREIAQGAFEFTGLAILMLALIGWWVIMP